MLPAGGMQGRRHSAHLWALVGGAGQAPVPAVPHHRLLSGQLYEQQGETIQVGRKGAAVADDLLRCCNSTNGQEEGGRCWAVYQC